MGDDALEALVVGDQDLRLRVTECVLHLQAGPPSVHPDYGGAERHGSPVADHPLRIVAHRQRNPVAATDAHVVVQIAGERPHLGMDVGERVALVLVDHVDLVALQRRKLPHRAQVGKGAGEDPHRDAAYGRLGHGEGCPWSSHLVPGGAQVIDHAADLAPSRGTCANAVCHRTQGTDHRRYVPFGT